jgi:predicted XRE-type DNA-binding protein
MRQRKPIEERYWAKVDTTGGPDACWPWTGNADHRGYGALWDGTYDDKGQGRKVKAHRWGYERFVGPIAPGMYVCHRCDVPACQNPAHWFLGTPGDNARDCRDKGRSHGYRTAGEANRASKLKESDVEAIRAAYEAGGISQKALAERYGVEQSLVSQIIRRVVWRHAA